jgi:ribosomal protein L40E
LGVPESEINGTLQPLVSAQAKKYEESLSGLIDVELERFPIYTEWLSKVKGVGPIMSAGLIAWIIGQKHTPECKEKRARYFKKKETALEKRAKRYTCDCPWLGIERFDTVSKLWKYAGLAPFQRRAKGEHLTFNPRLHTHLWKVVRSFMFQKIKICAKYGTKKHKKDTKCRKCGSENFRTKVSRGYYLYQIIRKELDARPDLANGMPVPPQQTRFKTYKPIARQYMAQRKMIKYFILCLFLKWRQLDGLPPTKSWAEKNIEHGSPPPPWTDPDWWTGPAMDEGETNLSEVKFK